MSDPVPHRRKGLLAGLRGSFLTGLVVVLPVGLTIYLIWTVIGWIDSWILPLIPAQFQPQTLVDALIGPDSGITVRGVGLIVFLIFTAIVGWIAKGLIGRSLLHSAERLVDRMPVVRSLYTGLKQIAETVFAQAETKFDKACLVQFPRPGIWAIGFVAIKAKGEVRANIPEAGNVWTVFVATTPNPTSGFLVYVPEKDMIMLDMSLEDAAKLIISAGLVYPNAKDPSKPLIAA